MITGGVAVNWDNGVCRVPKRDVVRTTAAGFFSRSSVRQEIVGKGEAVLIHTLLQLGAGARVNHSALNRFSGLPGAARKRLKPLAVE
jgi:hypothetical protein